MEKLELKYKLTEKDILSYFRWIYIYKLFDLNAILKSAVLIIVPAVYFFATHVSGFDNLLKVYLVIAVTALLYKIYEFIKLKSDAHSFMSCKHYLHKQNERIFTDEGAYRTFGKSEIMENWHNFYSYKETKTLYVIYPTKVEVFIVPKWTLKNADEVKFMAKCMKKIKERRIAK